MLMFAAICSQAARSVLQTLIGVWLFKDVLTVCVCFSPPTSRGLY